MVALRQGNIVLGGRNGSGLVLNLRLVVGVQWTLTATVMLIVQACNVEGLGQCK